MARIEMTDPNALLIFSAILLGQQSGLGIRASDIKDKTKIESANAFTCALDSLVDNGFITYRVLQTGTAGTTSKFYQTAPNVHLVLGH